VPSLAFADSPPKAKRPITEKAFLHLVKANKTISNRRVPASAIIKALLWAQQASKLHKALPEGGINLDECVVEGPFSFYDGLESGETPRHHENEFTTALAQTSVDVLSPELSQRYKNAGIDKVIVIPVSLSFTTTQFTSKYAPNFTFLDTIFEGQIIFESVDFGPAYVRFDNSTFQEQASFDSSNFESQVTFLGATFKQLVLFNGSKFKNNVTFDDVDFQDDVYFNSWVESELRIDKLASFKKAFIKKDLSFVLVIFGGEPDFTEANITGSVSFEGCKVAGNAFFTDLNSVTGAKTGSLTFADTAFSERAYFNNAKLNELSFSYQMAENEDTGQQGASTGASSPVVFDKRSAFTGLDCNRAKFHDVEFRDYADFSEAKFANHVDFSNAIFEGGVSFYNSQFPRLGSGTPKDAQSGIVLRGAQFLKGVNLDWKQIDGSLNSRNPDTLKRLESAFKQSGDLEGQNEVLYRRKYLEGSQAGRWQRLTNRFDLFFWGYGVRPLRLLGWMSFVVMLFTIIYLTQTRALGAGGNKLKSAFKRLKFALAFSLRTSWSLGFGINNACTPTFKVITLVHSIGFKILLLCLLQAFANTSPLLNQLVGKLIHV